MFRRRAEGSRPTLLQERLGRLVRDVRDASPGSEVEQFDGQHPDLRVMALLVELRTAGKRGGKSGAAEELGPDFTSYLSQFYNLPAERQPAALQALLRSCRQEQDGRVDEAVRTCKSATQLCPDYPLFVERLARLEASRGDKGAAERWYLMLVDLLERLELESQALDACRELVELGITDSGVLERCAERLEVGGELRLAARCWSERAERMRLEGQPGWALTELDRALHLQPDDARLHLELAMIYEALEAVDQAASAYERAESLATNDSCTLGRILLMRARVSRPEEASLGRLMDLLEVEPQTRMAILEHCREAVAQSPYNPHLRYLQGVLLAQDGQLETAVSALRVAIDRYAVQADGGSELEARLILQQIEPADEENWRRVAAIHFTRGEVHLAMKVLAGLARIARSDASGSFPLDGTATGPSPLE